MAEETRTIKSSMELVREAEASPNIRGRVPFEIEGVPYRQGWKNFPMSGQGYIDGIALSDMVDKGFSKLRDCKRMDNRLPERVAVVRNYKGEIKATPIW